MLAHPLLPEQHAALTATTQNCGNRHQERRQHNESDEGTRGINQAWQWSDATIGRGSHRAGLIAVITQPGDTTNRPAISVVRTPETK
jgi:hypothetical protein